MTSKNVEQLDSPVKRLYEILEKARSMPDTVAVRYVWADALGVDREDIVSIYHALADLFTLFNAAKQSIETLKDVNRDDYLKPFDQIEEVIKQSNLDQRWEALKRTLSATTMLALKLAANTATVDANTVAVDAESLKNLQKEVDELIETVVDVNFSSDELKSILLEHLEIIRRAILAYRVSGNEGLRRSVAGSLGDLFLHREQIDSEARQDDEKKEVLTKFLNLLANISQVASFGLQIAQLSGILPPLLGPGGN